MILILILNGDDDDDAHDVASSGHERHYGYYWQSVADHSRMETIERHGCRELYFMWRKTITTTTDGCCNRPELANNFALNDCIFRPLQILESSLMIDDDDDGIFESDERDDVVQLRLEANSRLA